MASFYFSFPSLLPIYVLSIDAIWGCRPRPLELQIYPAAHVTNRGAQSSQNSPTSNWWKGTQVVVTKDRILTTKWSFRNIMWTSITHSNPACCSSVYLCRQFIFSFLKTIILDGFSLRCPRYMHVNSCGFGMWEGFCIKTNTEMYTWKTLKINDASHVFELIPPMCILKHQ